MRLRALFAWLLLASLPALAEEAAAPGRGFDELFRRMDRDGDGKLTREEMKAPRLFEAMDANRDGFVTLEEARAHFANQAEGEDAQEPAGQEAPAWVTPAARGPRLQQRIFDSAAAKSKVSFHVYVPEAHDAERDRRFPVLYWLHGSGGGLSGVPQLAERFDSAIRAGKVPPMLVVFPNGLADGMWCDSRDGKTPVETVILKELVPLVDASFRTVASREGRIVEGFSMGGYGAGRFGLKRPDLFAAASMLGAGPLHPDFETRRVGPRGRDWVLKKVYGGDMEYYRDMSPWRLAEKNAETVRGQLRLRMAIGERDETLDFNREFHEHLAKLEIPHSFTVAPGVGHDCVGLLDALGDAFWAFHREALAALAQSGGDRSPGTSKPCFPGDHARTILQGGRARAYTVRVPPAYDGVTPIAVVVMLHGGAGNGKAAAEETGWSAKADREGFLAVYPEGTPPDASKPASFRDHPQTWNDGSGRFGAERGAADDVAFLAALLDDLAARFALDAGRVFVTGFSNGASMAFRAGAELSARIAAVAPVAGACWAEKPALARGVPLLYVTGTADPLNPMDGGMPRTASGGRELGGREKPPVRESVRRWVEALQCPAEPFVLGTKDVRTLRFGPGRDGAEVFFTTVDGLGHTWAGGKSLLPSSIVGASRDDPDATGMIWEFFRTHPRLAAGAPTPPGAYRVGFTIVDFPYETGGAKKTMAVAVWYPTDAPASELVYGGPTKGFVAKDAPPRAAGGPFPLLVFSHGYGGAGIGSVFFTEALAARGWIVAAPDHNDPESAVRSRTGQTGDLAEKLALLRTAREISRSGPETRDQFAWRLDEMKAALDGMFASEKFGKLVDSNRIAVGGHSMGGFSSLGVCGTIPGRRDPRVKAVLIFSSGAAGYLFRKEELEAVDLPAMVWIGEREQDDERGEQTMREIVEKVCKAISAPGYYLEVREGTHFSFNSRFADNAFARRLSGADEQHEVIRRYSIAFLEKHVAGRPDAARALDTQDRMITRFLRTP